MLVGITGFTTLLVIDSLTSIGSDLEKNDEKRTQLEEVSRSRFSMLAMAILVQSWVSGLFLGKITTGNYSGGFMYSVFLVILAIGAIVVIESGIFSVSAVFGTI